MTCVSSATYCLTCNTATHNRIINLTSNTCPCIDGYYETSLYTPLICLACNPTCITCLTSASICTSCDLITQMRILDSTSQTCICTNGFYETSPGAPTICLPCDPICLTCQSSPGYCTSCNATNNRILSNNSCICSNGFYENSVGSPLVCLACHPTCITCTTSSTTCQSCDLTIQHRTFNSTSSICECISGYYETSLNNPTNCLPIGPIGCHYSCLTCSGGLNTSCLSCSAADFRIFNSATSECLCLSGYF